MILPKGNASYKAYPASFAAWGIEVQQAADSSQRAEKNSICRIIADGCKLTAAG